ADDERDDDSHVDVLATAEETPCRPSARRRAACRRQVGGSRAGSCLVAAATLRRFTRRAGHVVAAAHAARARGGDHLRAPRRWHAACCSGVRPGITPDEIAPWQNG